MQLILLKDFLKRKINIYLRINHVRNHHNLISAGFGESKGQFCCFDVKSKDNWLRPFNQVWSVDNLGCDNRALAFDGIPATSKDFTVN